MFSAHCDTCGHDWLLTTRRIVDLRPVPDGILVVFRCWEGHLGSFETGRDAVPLRRREPAA